MNYIPTIGLEIHAELLTQTKMFCSCLNDPTEITPNKNVCPICMGHPGTLPVPNKKVIEYVIRTGLALNCDINKHSKFDRKNYFYPDLPKAYQISQYDLPFCKDGYMVLPQSGKKIRIRRIHLEEDTAKLQHGGPSTSSGQPASLVDFNRAGVPLMELVTEPDFHSADEVVEFAQEFQLILRYLGVSDGDMEKGHLRLEANISVAPADAKELGTKVEIKNINSFRFMKAGIEYEIARHTKLYEEGKEEKVVQETRGWNEQKQETFSQRSKEEAHDYRYFPEPDIPPFDFADDYIEELRNSIAELPQQRRERYASEYNLSEKQTDALVQDPAYADFFEEAISELRELVPNAPVDLVYNYLMSDIRGIEVQKAVSLQHMPLKPVHLAFITAQILQDKISSRTAKDVLLKVYKTGDDPDSIIRQEGLAQISDLSELEKIVADVCAANPSVVEEYKSGKTAVLQFLVGKVMAQTKGRANPAQVKTLLEKFEQG
ncbi:glutaminyl-tRNA synthase (glutamine-hydrolyzing) subunit B [Candidatus Wolfebacteria bacterium RIFCSPLOWO2_01_FULL_47_17b]|uniref:Aspartyl/glutamyl-tRNA(Asn/Gln) amidotransferase subunit B n=1 Tax=Candidatus Wolfebacteria bacterium RIFCSPLOWO2_01_FULL_47_17b TaxID=1802558 RepID=A0A1F8DW38_9BACT|nr:MAG: glutaminyl-tRNA synthase (glutamine-hydrolyzing) subunit B [Candidatus Wolfebacteria bacterium RIFCSPLOWO2_01_FULL_47_17b]